MTRGVRRSGGPGGVVPGTGGALPPPSPPLVDLGAVHTQLQQLQGPPRPRASAAAAAPVAQIVAAPGSEAEVALLARHCEALRVILDKGLGDFLAPQSVFGRTFARLAAAMQRPDFRLSIDVRGSKVPKHAYLRCLLVREFHECEHETPLPSHVTIHLRFYDAFRFSEIVHIMTPAEFMCVVIGGAYREGIKFHQASHRALSLTGPLSQAAFSGICQRFADAPTDWPISVAELATMLRPESDDLASPIPQPVRTVCRDLARGIVPDAIASAWRTLGVTSEWIDRVSDDIRQRGRLLTFERTTHHESKWKDYRALPGPWLLVQMEHDNWMPIKRRQLDCVLDRDMQPRLTVDHIALLLIRAYQCEPLSPYADWPGQSIVPEWMVDVSRPAAAQEWRVRAAVWKIDGTTTVGLDATQWQTTWKPIERELQPRGRLMVALDAIPSALKDPSGRLYIAATPEACAAAWPEVQAAWPRELLPASLFSPAGMPWLKSLTVTAHVMAPEQQPPLFGARVCDGVRMWSLSSFAETENIHVMVASEREIPQAVAAVWRRLSSADAEDGPGIALQLLRVSTLFATARATEIPDRGMHYFGTAPGWARTQAQAAVQELVTHARAQPSAAATQFLDWLRGHRGVFLAYRETPADTIVMLPWQDRVLVVVDSRGTLTPAMWKEAWLAAAYYQSIGIRVQARGTSRVYSTALEEERWEQFAAAFAVPVERAAPGAFEPRKAVGFAHCTDAELRAAYITARRWFVDRAALIPAEVFPAPEDDVATVAKKFRQFSRRFHPDRGAQQYPNLFRDAMPHWDAIRTVVKLAPKTT